MQVKFFIPGPPAGKGRPRFGRHDGEVVTYTPEKTSTYEEKVQLCYLQQVGRRRFPDNAYLEMHIVSRHPVPKSETKVRRALMLSNQLLPAKKPDIDNIVKIIQDALNGLAYKDDKQFVGLHVMKVYSDTPGIEVLINDVADYKPATCQHQYVSGGTLMLRDINGDLHELDPCSYSLIEKYENVTVEISICQKCGKVDISWIRQDNTKRVE